MSDHDYGPGANTFGEVSIARPNAMVPLLQSYNRFNHGSISPLSMTQAEAPPVPEASSGADRVSPQNVNSPAANDPEFDPNGPIELYARQHPMVEPQGQGPIADHQSNPPQRVRHHRVSKHKRPKPPKYGAAGTPQAMKPQTKLRQKMKSNRASNKLNKPRSQQTNYKLLDFAMEQLGENGVVAQGMKNHGMQNYSLQAMKREQAISVAVKKYGKCAANYKDGPTIQSKCAQENAELNAAMQIPMPRI